MRNAQGLTVALSLIVCLAWPAAAEAESRPAAATQPAATAEDAPAGKAEAKAAPLPAGASEWADKKFVHPPLKCMRLYKRIDEFPVVAWCFHGRGAPGYNEKFVEQAGTCGFNVLLDAAIMLKPVEKFEGMKVLAVVFRFPPERITREVFKPFGDHRRLLGFVLDDNCPRIYGWSIKASNWLRAKYPHVVPYISENPDARGQSRTAMRVLGTQNYGLYRYGGGPYAIRAYCSHLERDRINGNKYDMSFWPLFSAPGSTSEIRFQAFAAVAHGAQGIVYFAYSPGDRWPQWKPGGSVAKAAYYANSYITSVVGRHLWGNRCLTVVHAHGDGTAPAYASRPAKGAIVEDIDQATLAGLLMPEADFYAETEKKVPLYAMVVDKRSSRRDVHKPRTARISFGPDVKLVEVLARKTGTEADEIRKIEPPWSVPLKLLAGDGILLRLNPEGVEELFGPGGREYVTAVESIGALRRKARGGELGIAEFDRTLAYVRRRLSALDAATDAAESGGADKLLVLQRRDMLKRLTGQLDRVRSTILQPKFVTAPGVFAGRIRVELASMVKGSEMRYTTDGSEPTLTSRRYDGAIMIGSTTELRIRGVGKHPRELVGKEVSARFEQVRGRLAGLLQINFQPRDVPVPRGMLADYGERLKTHESGWTYGWDRDMKRQVKAQGIRKDDPARDTFVLCAPRSAWEIALETGSYAVTVSIGDDKKGVRFSALMAEGGSLSPGEKLPPKVFKTWTKIVKVADGRLTIETHGLGWKYQNRINWIKIGRK
ncbi:MAG: chitobiase/beta-hexosaminidase C-terminal domain-containing protein [Planctomycetota bacterium]|jgi:hypothetical protein